MKNILLLGAGRSSSAFINYYRENAEREDVTLFVADVDLTLAERKTRGHSHLKPVSFSIEDKTTLRRYIEQSQLVVSMLPAFLHAQIVEECISLKTNMLTASYVDDKIRRMHKKAQTANISIIMECGLDPGIDHMSAMAELDKIREAGGEIISFKSFTGGLIAPESDDNPWHYKITWNPRNVVLSGTGTARFIRNHRYKYIPYHQVYRRRERVVLEGLGEFDGYANRDSLKYIEMYRLKGIPTILRGTLRYPGFCDAWDMLIQLGMTEDTYRIIDEENMTYRSFTNSFFAYDPEMTLEDKFKAFFSITEEDEKFKKIKWLGLFDDKPLTLKKASPAQHLQALIEEKWLLKPEDKDMIVMQHQIEYKKDGEVHKKYCSLVVKGDNAESTSMAKTVGLPLAIASKLLLENKISRKGVHIPVHKEIYEPVLSFLSEYGISFTESN